MRRAISLFVLYLGMLVLWALYPEPLNWLGGLSSLIVLTIILVVHRTENLPLRESGIRKDGVSLKRIGIGLGFGAGIVGLFHGIYFLTGWSRFGEAIAVDGGQIVRWAIQVTILSTIEEIIFRGYMLHRLQETVSPVLALFISSLMFGIIHVPIFIIDGIPLLSVLIGVASFSALGGILGMLTIEAGNIWVATSLHASYNFASSMILLIIEILAGSFRGLNYVGPAWLIGDLAWIPESGVAGMLILLLLCVLQWRRSQKGELFV